MARSTLPLSLLAALLFLPLAPVAADPDPEPVADPATADEGGFIPPQIILGTQKQPDFPPAAWDARYTGSVVLDMTVMKDGTVENVRVQRCTRPKVGFEEAAVAAVRQWRFEPGMENGEAIEVDTRVKLNFTRLGVGVQARPAVSAGSVTLASSEEISEPDRAASTTPSPSSAK